MDPLCYHSVPSGFTHLSLPQKMSSPARTVAFGTAVSGICKLTSCTTAPVAKAPAPLPQPSRMRSPRSHTPTSASAPSPSAAKAALAPAPWRSTCAATVVRPHAPQAPRLLYDSMWVPAVPKPPHRTASHSSQSMQPTCGCLDGQLGAGPGPGSWEARRALHTWPMSRPLTGPYVPGERPFVCLICLSAFTTKANCERHLKVHTDTLSGRQAGKGTGGGSGVSVEPTHSRALTPQPICRCLPQLWLHLHHKGYPLQPPGDQPHGLPARLQV